MGNIATTGVFLLGVHVIYVGNIGILKYVLNSELKLYHLNAINLSL